MNQGTAPRGDNLLAGPPGASLPQIEVLTHTPEALPPPWHQAVRLRVFLVALCVLALPAMAWNLLRPAQYRAVATLLTQAAVLDGRVDPEPRPLGPDTQHLTIQGRVLLGEALLADTLRTVDPALAAAVGGTGALRARLSVTPLPDTNLVELSAAGDNPAELAPLVNAWVAAYQVRREAELQRELDATLSTLADELAKRAQAIATKRDAIEAFRGERDIVTLEREGNAALARYRALTTDLNKARDQAVEAEARLAALEEAIARGDPVVPEGEQAGLAALEEKAVELRAALTELSKRYTSFYLQHEPSVRVIPAQIAEIEAKIAEKLARAREVMQVEARQEVAQARRRVEVLAADLARHSAEAARFTSAFAQYEAMQQELTVLAQTQAAEEARLVELETASRDKYPQVELVDPAFPPTAHFYPHYGRDALVILGAALVGALLVVLVWEFLTRKPRHGAPPVTGVRVYGGAPPLAGGRSAPALAYGQPILGAPALMPGGAGLPAPLPRELSPAEVAALWAAADLAGRQLLVLLLSGLDLEECAALEPRHFDLEGALVHAPGPDARAVPLSPTALGILAGGALLPAWSGDPAASRPEELAARLTLLAHDAGLAMPAGVTAEALRHTYVAFLVRQGARLTELSSRIGYMPAATLHRYAAMAPPGPARGLGEIDTRYPLA